MKLAEAEGLAIRLGLFDADYYSRRAQTTFASPREAFAHFVEHGWRQALNPSPLFDTAFYLRRNPALLESKSNPIFHYLKKEWRRGRLPRLGRGPIADNPAAPDASLWDDLGRRGAGRIGAGQADDGSAVDVVVPVYGGYHGTLACLYSVLASKNVVPFRLVVIDDQSPDALLSKELERLAGIDLFLLLKNETNLGFVGTANRGMRLSRKNDVLLLNSDTIVYGDWLDRLHAQAKSDDRIGTLTPLSNNATIMSYPYTLKNNNQALEVGFPELDRLCADTLTGQSCEVPTGVGFCFYVTRRCIDEIGVFNEAVFGRGYGEENDLCRRAAKAGWSNKAALDVFVRHTGEVSFKLAGLSFRAEAVDRVVSLHPDYREIVRAFIEADPMRWAREALDSARARSMGGGRAVLFVEHGLGGGVETHIRKMAELMAREGVTVFRAWPTKDATAANLEVMAPVDLPNLPQIPFSNAEAVAAVLHQLDVGHVHIHSLVGYPPEWFHVLSDGIGKANLAFDVTHHDYSAICPRIRMVDWGGVYCNSLSVEHCRTCLREPELPGTQVEIEAWRSAHAQLLASARRIFVPHVDVAERLERHGLRDARLRIRPHAGETGQEPRADGPRRTHTAGDAAKVVGIIGAIGPEKGSGLLIRLAGDALRRKLLMRFILYGYSNRPELVEFSNVTVTGRYAEDEVDDLLARLPCDLALYPSVWPETFCYTLDVAFRNRIHPVAFDIGAPAERIKATKFGTLLPLDLYFDARALNDRLLSIEPPVSSSAVEPERGWVSIDDYYDILPRRGRGGSLSGVSG